MTYLELHREPSDAHDTVQALVAIVLRVLDVILNPPGEGRGEHSMYSIEGAITGHHIRNCSSLLEI